MNGKRERVKRMRILTKKNKNYRIRNRLREVIKATYMCSNERKKKSRNIMGKGIDYLPRLLTEGN